VWGLLYECFIIRYVFVIRSCQYLAQTPSQKTTHFRLSTTLFQYIRSYPPYWRPFLHPQNEDVSCRGTKTHWVHWNGLKIIIIRALMIVIPIVFTQSVTMKQVDYILHCIIVILKAACFDCSRQPSSRFTFTFIFTFLKHEGWCLSRTAKTCNCLYYCNKPLCIDNWFGYYVKCTICCGTHSHKRQLATWSRSFLSR
jgi:hypothetical protein